MSAELDTTSCPELKIITPIGMLGYGFSHSLLRSSILTHRPDAIILDSGSTDSGPAKLATGETSSPHSSYVEDMGPLLENCFHYKIPLLISSSCGDGTDHHVDELMDIIKEHSSNNGYSFKVIRIYSNVDKATVHSKLNNGKITPCGPVHELTPELIDTTRTIVAQIGHEPLLQAMDQHPDFDIMITGRAYDPTPYAAFTMFKSQRRIPAGLAYHMGKIMECGAVCAEPKSKAALATIREDSFDITPLDPGSRCTTMSVAAHSLYEKPRPDILHGPGGYLDLNQTKYEALPDGISVRCTGAEFVSSEPGKYTLKLEGARASGYRYMFMGGIRDPILISEIDTFLQRVREYTEFMHKDIDFKILFHVYGKNAIMGDMEPVDTVKNPPHEICLVCDIQAPTPEEAQTISHTARVACMHGPYKGQLATAGNFAMGSTNIPMGAVCDFTVYHLMEVDDPLEFARTEVELVRSNKPAPGLPNGEAVSQSQGKHKTAFPIPTISRDRNSKPVFIADVAKVIRSKNAGPFELTMDIMFPASESETYFALKKASPPILSAEIIGKLYNLKPEQVAVFWWDQAFAFKATIPRPKPSGGFGETDVQGAQFHAPLLSIRLDGSVEVNGHK